MYEYFYGDNEELLITLIKDISSKKKLVYINYEPAFELYIGELRRYNIIENSSVSYDTYEEIISVLKKRAIIRTMHLLKSKDYTEQELREKLNGNNYPKTCINEAVEYAKKYGYIDDLRYTDTYVNMKCASKSRKYVTLWLKKKGVDVNVIEKICDRYYSESECELNNIIKLITKKLNGRKYDVLEYSEKQKILSYIYRKGYNMDLIDNAVDVILDNDSN